MIQIALTIAAVVVTGPLVLILILAAIPKPKHPYERHIPFRG